MSTAFGGFDKVTAVQRNGPGRHGARVDPARDGPGSPLGGVGAQPSCGRCSPNSPRRFRPVFGPPPLTGGGGEVLAGGWLELRESRPVDALALCLFADAWWPAAWGRVRELVMTPTVELTVHFRQGLDAPPPGPVLARFSSRVSREGYRDEDGERWSGDRRCSPSPASCACSGRGHHPRGDVHAHAANVAHIAVPQLDLADVQPGADLDPHPVQVLTQRGRAADRPRGAVEGGQDPVAGGLDQPSMKRLDPAGSRLVVDLEQLPPPLVAQVPGALGGADNGRRRPHSASRASGRRPPGVGSEVLEPLGQRLVRVHRSHPPVARCLPGDRPIGVGVTQPPRGGRTQRRTR